MGEEPSTHFRRKEDKQSRWHHNFPINLVHFIISEMLEHLIVDSGAIIKGCGFDFHKTAKRYEKYHVNDWSLLQTVPSLRSYTHIYPTYDLF